MILSVTPNSTIDYTIHLPFFRWGETIRADQAVWGMAGKPADASWVLGELGYETTATGFAAGQAGERMVALLRKKHVVDDFVQVAGETRLNVHLVDQESGGQSTITVDSLEVHDDHINALFAKVVIALDQAAVMITGGSLPKCMTRDFFHPLITMAKEKGVPVIFDSSHPHLLAGLKASPDVIKPNGTELASVVGHPVATLEDAYHAACQVKAEYGSQVVVTLGSQGGLAVLNHGSYHILPPPIPKVVSTAGAGDAVLAGIAWALAFQQPLDEGIRLGFAAAGAVIQTPATADCKREDVMHLLPAIEMIPYP